MRTRMVNGRPQWIVFDLNSPLSHYADAAAAAASFDDAAVAAFDDVAAAAAFEEGIADEYEEDPAAYEEEAALFDNHVAALFEEANATRMALMNDSHTLQNAAIASAAAVAASSIVVSSSEVLPAVTSSLSVNAAAASPESVKFAFPWMYQALPPIAKPMNFLIENYEQLSVIRHGRDGDVIKGRNYHWDDSCCKEIHDIWLGSSQLHCPRYLPFQVIVG
ncbi:hypothetical protein ZOSMA_113G00300 [Zostera marina]|uniref:Uncharacterized protein n=1 Tax=Zostera marina TaxID=29655 RepID=A0A0K9Q2P2_ZOSMR|nr:hypothetical protein ZOSMA_113G00300 [Zostera marina]